MTTWTCALALCASILCLSLKGVCGEDCRERYEPIGAPLVYLTTPNNTLLDWWACYGKCRAYHPGYTIIEERYRLLNDAEKSPCKNLLVPLGLGLFKYDVARWFTAPRDQEEIGAIDLANNREIGTTAPDYAGGGALNLTDGTWRWVDFQVPLFSCVICDKQVKKSLSDVTYPRLGPDYPYYLVTLTRLPGTNISDQEGIQQAVAAIFNVTRYDVRIRTKLKNLYDSNKTHVHVRLYSEAQSEHWAEQLLNGSIEIDSNHLLTEVARGDICREETTTEGAPNGQILHWPETMMRSVVNASLDTSGVRWATRECYYNTSMHRSIWADVEYWNYLPKLCEEKKRTKHGQ